MHRKFLKLSLLAWLYIAGAVLLVAAGALFCYKNNADPERVFWNTIEHGMTTRGVTVGTEPSSGTVVRYSLGANNLAHSVTTLTQVGTVVKSEAIGTPLTDYVRYTDIVTDQRKADGSEMDFSHIVGVWTRSQEGAGNFFAQALFGGVLPVGGLGVPLGNLNPEARAELMQQIRSNNVYHIDFSKAKKEWADGRLQYTYDVTVQPVAYVALMKRFAQVVGLHGLDQLDPNTYEGQQSYPLQMTVDAFAKRVVRITDTTSGNVQTYSSYDVPVQVAVPTDTISNQELQRRLQELQ